MDTKNWYMSKTIWGGLMMLVATALQVTGVVSVTVDEQGMIVDSLTTVITSAVQIVGAVLAIYGRAKAKTVIG